VRVAINRQQKGRYDEDTMKVNISTSKCNIYSGEACSVIATTEVGELQVLPGHAPLLAILRAGMVYIDCIPDCDCPDGKQDAMVVLGGFLEVQPDTVTILADDVERSEEMDTHQAEQAVLLAQEQLRNAPPESTDKAMLALEIALAHLSIAKRRLQHGKR